MSVRKSLLFGSLLVLVALLNNGCNSDREERKNEDIVIASANSMSGSARDSGEMKVKAIQLAFDEVNREGGINGKELKLLVGDDAGSPKEANKLADQFANNPAVLAVFGPWNSACTLAARNIYNRAGIPVITDSAKKSITDKTTPYLFRILPSDKAGAEQLADYSFHKLKLKKIAIVYVNNEYGIGIKEYFREAVKQNGGEVTTIETFFDGRTTDFTAELNKIKNSQPDGVFIAGYYTETALIVRQAREIGLKVPIIATDAAGSEELIHLGGTAVEGIRFIGFFHTDVKRKGSEKFIMDFKNRYQKEPDSNAALAYDSAQILINAIRIKGTSRNGIYEYLTELKNYPGITGNITFDENHDVNNKILILTVKDGRIVQDILQP